MREIHVKQRECRTPSAWPLILEFTVEPALHGVRIDSFLSRHLRNYTPQRLQRMISAGCVRVDSTRVSLVQRVGRRQFVQIRLVEPPDKLLTPESGHLRVVAEDAWILVLDKPAGLVTHPVGEFQSGTLVNIVQAYFDGQSRAPGLLRPGVVHRLDRMTSGLVVLAKQHTAHTHLSLQFQNHRVRKTYVALLNGHLPSDAGEINLPIGRIASTETVLMSTARNARNRKRAQTSFTVIERTHLPDRTPVTLVRAAPRTGRVHQIRLHFASLGFPILGDEFYGPWGEIIKPREEHHQPSVDRHALHAETLSFLHPITGITLNFTSPHLDHSIFRTVRSV